MDGGVVIEAVGVTFDELSFGPSFAAIAGDGSDIGIAFFGWKGEEAGVVVVDGEEVVGAGDAFDAGGTVGGFHLGGRGWCPGAACIGGGEAPLLPMIGAAPGQERAVGSLDDAGLLQTTAAGHGQGPPTGGFLPSVTIVVGVEPGGDSTGVE